MLRISVQHLAAGRVELLNKVYRCHNRVATSATQIKAAVLGAQLHVTSPRWVFMTEQERKRLAKLFEDLEFSDDEEKNRPRPKINPSVEALRRKKALDASQNEVEVLPDETDRKEIVKRFVRKFTATDEEPTKPVYIVPETEDTEETEDSELDADVTKRFKEPIHYLDSSLSMEIFDIKRVVNMTSGGKVESFVALIAVGNGKGVCGYARGKSSDPTKAIVFAIKEAQRRLIFIPRYNDHTITHAVRVKWEQTRLYMRPRPAGSGLTAHSMIQRLCQLCGITDISANIIGSTNKLNILRAWFQAMEKQRTLEEICQARGKNVVALRRAVRVAAQTVL